MDTVFDFGDHMKIVVMSDSHGKAASVNKIFEKTKDVGDIFVHLGDGLKELDDIRVKYPKLDIRTVAGNCDYGVSAPLFNIIRAGNVNIYAAHGHMLRVNYGTDFIRRTAAGFNCKIVMFGHTHCRLQTYDNNMYLFNPGSCAQPRDFTAPSYGIIEITDKGIMTNILDL